MSFCGDDSVFRSSLLRYSFSRAPRSSCSVSSQIMTISTTFRHPLNLVRSERARIFGENVSRQLRLSVNPIKISQTDELVDHNSCSPRQEGAAVVRGPAYRVAVEPLVNLFRITLGGRDFGYLKSVSACVIKTCDRFLIVRNRCTIGYL